MKKIVFIVHTEYHLLFALKIMLSFHKDGDNEILIYQLSPKGSKRLNQELDFEDTDIVYRQIIYENRKFQARDLRPKLDEIILVRPDVLYVFNEAQKVYSYLFGRLKQIGSRIGLCPDGAYVYFNNTPLKKRFIQFLYGNIFLWSNKFPSFLPFPSCYYAYHKEIDDVVVEDKTTYHNYTNKNIIEIKEQNYSREKFISLADHIFRFNPLNTKIPSGSILWIDQPVEGMEESKRLFLVELKRRYPLKKIYVKPHPHSFPSEINRLSKIEGFQIINLNIPVELLVDNLKNVNILSAFSTAMFYKNPTCTYYWVSPIFKELPLEYAKLATFEHIEVVSSLEQIDL